MRGEKGEREGEGRRGRGEVKEERSCGREEREERATAWT